MNRTFSFGTADLFKGAEKPKPQAIDRQNGVLLKINEMGDNMRLDMIVLDKLNVNINEDWGPIGQLPSVN